jgi:hypothetical protein
MYPLATKVPPASMASTPAWLFSSFKAIDPRGCCDLLKTFADSKIEMADETFAFFP